MKKVALFTVSILLLPLITHAQGLITFFKNLTTFLNNAVIPLLLGIGFLIFVINAIRFFVLGSTNEQGRENAKKLAIYSIAAFVLVITFWGIINVINFGLGFGGKKSPTPDYVEEMGV